MNGCIEYKEIANLTLEEALYKFLHSEKLRVGEAKLDDFAIVKPLGSIKLHEFNYKNCFGYGVYLLFEKKNPVYVGMTADSFFNRILSHCNTELKPFWGWNALLKKIADREREEKSKEEATPKELMNALTILKGFEILRVNVSADLWNKQQCKKLEKILQRAYKYQGYEILNTRTGHLNTNDLQKNVYTLI